MITKKFRQGTLRGSHKNSKIIYICLRDLQIQTLPQKYFNSHKAIELFCPCTLEKDKDQPKDEHLLSASLSGSLKKMPKDLYP